MWYINKRDAIYIVLFHSSPGAFPASMIPTPIPANLDYDSNSSHLGYDSDSDSNIILYEPFQLRFLLDSNSIATPEINDINSDFNTSPDDK